MKKIQDYNLEDCRHEKKRKERKRNQVTTQHLLVGLGHQLSRNTKLNKRQHRRNTNHNTTATQTQQATTQAKHKPQHPPHKPHSIEDVEGRKREVASKEDRRGQTSPRQ
jgi:hypothetical protein